MHVHAQFSDLGVVVLATVREKWVPRRRPDRVALGLEGQRRLLQDQIVVEGGGACWPGRGVRE